jgi:hypothetical protein
MELVALLAPPVPHGTVKLARAALLTMPAPMDISSTASLASVNPQPHHVEATLSGTELHVSA